MAIYLATLVVCQELEIGFRYPKQEHNPQLGDSSHSYKRTPISHVTRKDLLEDRAQSLFIDI
jgi:hypothetical protein